MMGTLRLLFCSFLFWLPGALAAPPEPDPACGDCYRIDTPTLIGVVLGDIALTIIIILVVYYCTKQSFQNRQDNDNRKVYMNMPLSRQYGRHLQDSSRPHRQQKQLKYPLHVSYIGKANWYSPRMNRRKLIVIDQSKTFLSFVEKRSSRFVVIESEYDMELGFS